MSRPLCHCCQRPKNACICSFITAVKNDIPVFVLQHPSEVKQSKGTVALLAKSLTQCQVLVGENFTENKILAEILVNYNALLLYPSERACELAYEKRDYLQEKECKPPCVIIIDGTWKKAYRIFMLSQNLHRLVAICLPESIASSGQYLIRKVAKKNALSSLEACCYALAMLEQGALVHSKTSESGQSNTPVAVGKYQELLEQFAKFNQFQLAFIPK